MADESTGWEPSPAMLFRTFLLLAKVVVRASPGLALVAFVLVPATEVLSVLNSYWLKLVTNSIIDKAPLVGIAGAALALVGGTTYATLQDAGGRASLRLYWLAGFELEQLLADLSARLPGLEHHERPEFLNRLQLLRDFKYKLVVAVCGMIDIAKASAKVTFAAILLGRLDPLLLLLPVALIPGIWVTRISQRRAREVEDRTAESGRLADILAVQALTPGGGAELRIFNLQTEILGRVARARRSARQARRRTAWAVGLFSLIGPATSVLAVSAAVALVALKAMQGLATPGDVVFTFLIASQFNGGVGQLFGCWSYFLESARTATRLTWLLDYERDRGSTPSVQDVPPLIQGIRFCDVGFHYPGGRKDVLMHVDLDLPAGSVVAIVGETGAGKTTLIKLLLGFYAPTEGHIEIDGVDLRELDLRQWREHTAAAFQDYLRPELRVGEAVGVGDLPRLGDEPALHAAIARAGAKDLIDDSRTLDTQLGREWGGVDLSGGQWQKVALARAFMRDLPRLLVLDEPTAALDSFTEHALFERFAAAVTAVRRRDGITILVTHRFSTVRMADLIVVLDDGRVAAMGDHEHLMARGGLYAELYRIQARGYGR